MAKGYEFRPAIVRFFEKFRTDENGCWLWQGNLMGNGYAIFSKNHRNVAGHRWSYEYFIGPVPEGLDLDHLCRVRHCVNPHHVEPVTRKENVRRSPIHQVSRTHCPSGHPYAGSNVRFTKEGHRRCAECNRQKVRRWEAVRRLSRNNAGEAA